MKQLVLLLFIGVTAISNAQEIALLKYNGGGDWYVNPTSLPNLIQFCNANSNTRLKTKPATVEPSDPDLFSYPFIHMTGHGNVIFNEAERKNLRKYLDGGGFLHIDDNYGMHQFVKREIKQLYPETELVELPSNHPLFQKPYAFENGLPKIHEHDGKRPQAFGIIIKNRLVLLYTHESDLGDGWEDAEVNNDPVEVRQKALKMGANIINYVFNN